MNKVVTEVADLVEENLLLTSKVAILEAKLASKDKDQSDSTLSSLQEALITVGIHKIVKDIDWSLPEVADPKNKQSILSFDDWYKSISTKKEFFRYSREATTMIYSTHITIPELLATLKEELFNCYNEKVAALRRA